MAVVTMGADTFRSSSGVLGRVAEKALAMLPEHAQMRPMLEEAVTYTHLNLDEAPVVEVEVFLAAVQASLSDWLADGPLPMGFDSPWYEGIATKLSELCGKLVRFIVIRKMASVARPDTG